MLITRRKYSAYTHLAGTPGDERLTKELYDTWKEQGLDHVTKSTYDVSATQILIQNLNSNQTVFYLRLSSYYYQN